MSKKPRSDGARYPVVWKAWLIGAGVGFGVIVLILAGFAAIMSLRDIPGAMLHPMAMAAAGIGCLVGGAASARLAGRQGLVLGAATGAVLWLVSAAVGLAVGNPRWDGAMFVQLGIMLLAASGGGVWGVSRAGRRKAK